MSRRLTDTYGRGFSTTNLWYFRQFYLAFSDRSPAIRHKPCGESAAAEKLHKPCGESPQSTEIQESPTPVTDGLSLVIEHPEAIEGFSPRLSWSHYRTLTKVENRAERLFYEIDFALEIEGQPLQLIEVKLAEDAISPALRYFHGKYQLPAVQLVRHLRHEQVVDGIELRAAGSYLSALEL